MNFKKSLIMVLTAASLIATAKAGNNLSVKLDVEGDSLQTTNRLTEVFQSELGKIPDVAMVNQGHWDLDVFVQGIYLDNGLLVFSTNIADHEQLPMAIRDSGVDTAKVRAVLLSRNLEAATSGYIGLSTSTWAQLHDVVANVILKINKQDFQACRNAVDLYGRGPLVTGSAPKPTPAANGPL